MPSALLSFLAALVTEPLYFLLSLSPLSLFLPPTDHFAPHPNVPFEGYYTRIVTSTNSTILIILSSVWNAPTKPHFVHFSHIPAGAAPDLRIDLFPSTIHDIPGTRHPNGLQEFTRIAGALGYCHTAEHTQTYSLRLPDPDDDRAVIEVDVTLTQRTPWHANNPLSTPEGAFAALTRLLPLHWNVFSHRSTAHYSVRRNNTIWASGTGTAHVEKNWGASFPHGWTWTQGFTDTASFCLAGGTILGQKAFLIAYRSLLQARSFAPPTTLLPFAMVTSPLLTVRHCSRDGTLGITAYNLFRTLKLVVDAVAPSEHERWIPLACPLAEGHVGTHAYETFEACVWVGVWERRWPWGNWVLCEKTKFEGAALEFGGAYSFLVEGG